MHLVQGAFLIVIILFLVLFFYFVPLGMWVQAVVSLGLGRIRIVDLIRMRLRKISPRLVTDGVINLHKAGLNQITTDMLETHYLAGGQVENIVQLTNAIQLLYNNHGLLIHTLKLNVVDDLNIYTLKLIY